MIRVIILFISLSIAYGQVSGRIISATTTEGLAGVNVIVRELIMAQLLMRMDIILFQKLTQEHMILRLPLLVIRLCFILV